MSEAKKCPFYEGVCGLDNSIVCFSNKSFCDLYKKAKKAFTDSSWHTGTPTEGGWYLTKVTDVDKPYEILKFENGKWSDYLDYDDVPEVVNDSFVLAYQKIEPFKEATE